MARLGDYIEQVNVRNRDLKVTKLVGLTIDKKFIPSVANVIGTDLSNYKVIKHEQFACSLMQVSRDGKMPVAMFEGDNAIMSPAYPMFEVKDKSKLLPQYLMMWFMRSEFDREASFYAVGGVRGSLSWEDFLDMNLPIPPIEKQKSLVKNYTTLTSRISLNERLIATLESTAQTLYRKTFVDNIDPENLPEGWQKGTIGEFCNVFTGRKNVDQSLKKGKYRFFSCSPDTFYSNEYISKGPAILVVGNGSYTGRVSFYDKPFDLYQRTYACIIKDGCDQDIIYYLYYVMLFDFQRSKREKGDTLGSSIPYIVYGDIYDFSVLINEVKCREFSEYAKILLNHTMTLLRENQEIEAMKLLLLTKMRN